MITIITLIWLYHFGVSEYLTNKEKLYHIITSMFIDGSLILIVLNVITKLNN